MNFEKLNFEKWESCYSKILKDFNFSKEEDEKSADLLNDILDDDNYYNLEELVEYVNNIVNINNIQNINDIGITDIDNTSNINNTINNTNKNTNKNSNKISNNTTNNIINNTINNSNTSNNINNSTNINNSNNNNNNNLSDNDSSNSNSNNKNDKYSFIIFGAGPSLKDNIKYIKNNPDFDEYSGNHIIIAADGATTALLEEEIIPDIIVTDLDGKIEDLLTANRLKSFFVIHAHGNNSKEIAKYTNKFEKVLPTTQSVPHDKLYNFGGFTDGDRAVFLAIALGASKIILGGMDFGDMTTSYSRPDIGSKIAKADEIKQKKLKYAEKLINWIANNEDVNISYINN